MAEVYEPPKLSKISCFTVYLRLWVFGPESGNTESQVFVHPCPRLYGQVAHIIGLVYELNFHLEF